MKFGVYVENLRPWTTSETIGMLGARAEELGFDSVWVSDHVVIPERMESTWPYGEAGAFTPATVGNCLVKAGLGSRGVERAGEPSSSGEVW